MTSRINGETPRHISKFDDLTEDDFKKLNAAIREIDEDATANFADKFCAIALKKGERCGADILGALESNSLFTKRRIKS